MTNNNDKISAIDYNVDTDILLDLLIKENQEIYNITEESNLVEQESESLVKLPEWCPQMSAVADDVEPPDKAGPPPDPPPD